MTAHMIEVLKLMACSANEQQAALPDFVVVADEIALLFDDEIRLIDTSVCPHDLRDGLRAIDERLSTMSEAPSLWTVNALATSPEWQALRDTARRLLLSLGVEVSHPDLSWAAYVRAR